MLPLGPHQIWETNQTVQLLHKAPGQSACYSNLNPIHLGNSGVQVSPRIRQHVDSTYTPGNILMGKKSGWQFAPFVRMTMKSDRWGSHSDSSSMIPSGTQGLYSSRVPGFLPGGSTAKTHEDRQGTRRLSAAAGGSAEWRWGWRSSEERKEFGSKSVERSPELGIEPHPAQHAKENWSSKNRRQHTKRRSTTL